MNPLIEHVGILVPDLEEGIRRWSHATGYTFSPIRRYRTERYVDHSDGTPHFHDARISFSLEGPPRIELMEVTGTGTHGPAEVGIHHLGMRGIDDPVGRASMLGLAHDGVSVDDEQRALLCFTDKRELDGIRLEFIAPLPGPLVSDSGAALPLDPESGRPDLWSSVR